MLSAATGKVWPMADRVRISCIVKRGGHYNPHERIEYVGGVNPNGTRWKLSENEAIAGIHAGKWDFFVHAGGREVDVIVAYHGSRAYLKTRNDNYLWDNLLQLPDCP
jgi:hypothetical protein